jgi:hypothetical protein
MVNQAPRSIIHTTMISSADSPSHCHCCLLRQAQIGDVSLSPVTFSEGADPNDIRQGLLGDCYLLAALSAAAASNDGHLIRSLIDDRFASQGIYGVRFFVHGRWITVVVDDYMPVFARGQPATAAPGCSDEQLQLEVEAICRRTGATGSDMVVEEEFVAMQHDYASQPRWEPLCCGLSLASGGGSGSGSDSDEKELWCLLVEKAFAKLHGSYAALEGGAAADTLRYLTGGLNSVIERHPAETIDQLWTRTQKLCSEGGLITAALNVTISDRKATSLGLVPGHAYSIIRVVEPSPGVRLVQLRNPW